MGYGLGMDLLIHLILVNISDEESPLGLSEVLRFRLHWAGKIVSEIDVRARAWKSNALEYISLEFH